MIIGGAFGKIVSSLVNDVLMPIIGVMLGGVNFTSLKYVLIPSSGDAAEVAILYGNFIQSVVDFLIIAYSIFLFTRFLVLRKKKEPDTPPAPPAQSQEAILLEEIRDLIKSKK